MPGYFQFMKCSFGNFQKESRMEKKTFFIFKCHWLVHVQENASLSLKKETGSSEPTDSTVG